VLQQVLLHSEQFRQVLVQEVLQVLVLEVLVVMVVVMAVVEWVNR